MNEYINRCINGVLINPRNPNVPDMIYLMNHICKGNRLLFTGCFTQTSKCSFLVYIFERSTSNTDIMEYFDDNEFFSKSYIEWTIQQEHDHLEIFLNRFVNVPDINLERAARLQFLEEIENYYLSQTKDVRPTELKMAELQDEPVEKLAELYLKLKIRK